jgi:hypothetical protein
MSMESRPWLRYHEGMAQSHYDNLFFRTVRRLGPITISAIFDPAIGIFHQDQLGQSFNVLGVRETMKGKVLEK